jgi:hypothetical protein
VNYHPDEENLDVTRTLSRLVLSNDLVTAPVAFTLAGRRVTKRDALLHFLTVVSMTVIGVVKTLLLKEL